MRYSVSRPPAAFGDYARPTVARLADIDEGNSGCIQTLRAMRDLAKASVRSTAQTVREKALALVKGLPDRAWYPEIQRLHNFVQTQIRYTYDPTDVELVQTPEKTLEYMQGDCDDQSTLLAALFDSIGHPARFIALGFNGETFSHVLVQTKIRSDGNDSPTGGNWLTCETIINEPLGWFPPKVTSYYILKV